jgi:hypothetical protein
MRSRSLRPSALCVISLLGICSLLPLASRAHSPSTGSGTAGMLGLTAVADIDDPSNGGTVSAGAVVMSGGVAQWVRVAGGGMAANTTTSVDYEMAVTQAGIGGTPDAATAASVGLDSTGTWIKYSNAGAAAQLNPGNYSCNATSWVQMHSNSPTRASSGTHTHTFTAN